MVCVRQATSNDTRGRCWLICSFANAFWSNGTMCMFMTSLLWAAASFCVKLLGDGLTIFQIVAFRSSVSLALSTMLVIFLRQSDPSVQLFGRLENLGLLLARGTAGAVAMTLFYISITLLPLGDAVTIFFSNVILTSLTSVLIGYEAPKWSIAAACLLCTGGIALISKPSFLGGTAGNTSALHSLGVLAGLGASAVATCAFLCIRSLAGREPAAVVAVAFHMVAAITAVMPMLMGYPRPATWPTSSDWQILLALAMASCAGQLFIARGFALLSPSKAAAINVLEVVHARVLSTLFLHDPLEVSGIAGSALVAAGVLMAQAGEGQGQGTEALSPDSATLSARPSADTDCLLSSTAPTPQRSYP